MEDEHVLEMMKSMGLPSSFMGDDAQVQKSSKQSKKRPAEEACSELTPRQRTAPVTAHFQSELYYCYPYYAAIYWGHTVSAAFEHKQHQVERHAVDAKDDKAPSTSRLTDYDRYMMAYLDWEQQIRSDFGLPVAPQYISVWTRVHAMRDPECTVPPISQVVGVDDGTVHDAPQEIAVSSDSDGPPEELSSKLQPSTAGAPVGTSNALVSAFQQHGLSVVCVEPVIAGCVLMLGIQCDAMLKMPCFLLLLDHTGSTAHPNRRTPGWCLASRPTVHLPWLFLKR